MKQIKLALILFLFTFIANGQIMRPDCDTIVLKNGFTYHGIVTGMSKRVVKFINCDTFGLPVITVYLKDVKRLNYDRIQSNLAKMQRQKQYAKAVEKENNLVKLLDTTKCIHFGIIPYQFLTRSSALYFRYDFKNHTSLEYRPSYTYATKVEPNEMFSVYYYDNFYFQGINNSFYIYLQSQRRLRVGFFLSYKYWWHGKETITNDASKLGGSSYNYYLDETRSTVMNGVGGGIEFMVYKKVYQNFDFHFFWNISLTYFSSYSHVYSIVDANYFAGTPSKTYPYNETKDRYYFNITCGFKIGYKKKLK